MYCQWAAEERAREILIAVMRQEIKLVGSRTHGRFREILASFFPLCGQLIANRSLADVVFATLKPQIDKVCASGYSREEVEVAISTIVEILRQHTGSDEGNTRPCENDECLIRHP